MTGLHFDVVGAAGPRTFFSRITKTTIAHGYLFTGLQGVGKKTFALRLAQSLLCEAQKDGVEGYDDTCASCNLFGKAETRHPDLFESAGALKIGDNDSALSFHESSEMTARDLVRQLALQSYAGGFRIFVLGDVDFATHHAANALLKFFEDPPPNVILLLTTSTPGRLLTTIRSRLIEIRFPSLRGAEVEEILKRKGFNAERARLGASLSQGSVTRALAALGDEEQLRAQVARWLFDVVAGRTPPQSWATRETLDEGLETLKSFVRDWIARSAAGPDAPMLATDFAAQLARLPKVESRDAGPLLGKLSDAARLARTNVSPALVAEFVRMALSGKG
ncbi:MAG: ATP-binding protein [Rhodanobacteraceae bacterium]